MESFGRDELRKLLLDIDEEVALELGVPSKKHRVVIVGGSAMLLSGLTSRMVTYDVDILEADEKVGEVLARYNMVNGRVSAYSDSLPYNFEDRLMPLELPTRAIEYLSPSPEDLAVMKLYAWRPNDREDLVSLELREAIDWKLLDRLVYDPGEAAASCLSERRYDEMVHVYELYSKEVGGEADV